MVQLFLLIVLIFVDAHLENSQSFGAEKLAQGTLKSVDEAIGWVKAKGTCNKASYPIPSQCVVIVDLPRKVNTQGEDLNISPGWILRGTIKSSELKSNKFLTISIDRARRVPVSAKDVSAFLTVTRRSSYEFGNDGKISEIQVSITIENFQGQKFFDLTIPVPYALNLFHNDGVEDMALLLDGFGVLWDYYPTSMQPPSIH